jgi:putative membrane protein
MMNGYWFGAFGWISMLIGLVISILIVVGLIWLVIWLIRKASHTTTYTGAPAAPQSPKEIAQMRYARGEITREQYQEILEDLNRS